MNIQATKLLGLAMMLPITSPLMAKSAQPNILIIFTDDQGYADCGFMGSTLTKTPALDKLASEGTVFNECYAQHVSGPSRAALLTGRYPLRNGGRSLNGDEKTIAEAVKEVGYQTICIGKWDLSNRQEIIEQMPNAQGFDYYFGPIGANDGGKANMYENNTYTHTITDMGAFSKLYTDKAIDFIENKRDKDKPFFLYLAHTMLHSVVGVSKEFEGTSKRGLYGDAVQELDHEVGRLIETIDNEGLRENTIIIYTTDNGPWCQKNYRRTVTKKYPKGSIFWGDPGELRDGKGSCYEGGSRVPCIMSMPGSIPAGVRKDGLISTLDFMPTFAKMCGFEMRDDVVIDGVNQSKMIFGKGSKSKRDNFCYLQVTNIGHIGCGDFKAIRDDRWKLLMPNRDPKKYHRFLSDFGTNGYELYDMKNDPSESVNLADKFPKEVDRLKKLHAEMLDSFEKEPQNIK